MFVVVVVVVNCLECLACNIYMFVSRSFLFVSLVSVSPSLCTPILLAVLLNVMGLNNVLFCWALMMIVWIDSDDFLPHVSCCAQEIARYAYELRHLTLHLPLPCWQRR